MKKIMNSTANINSNTDRNAMKNRSAYTAQPGASGGAVSLTLPKGSYTIDGDGNLTIHSSAAPGGRPSPLCPGLSYAEFMEMTDGRGASCGAGYGAGDSGDPFGMDLSALGADPGKLVRECRGTAYGYARCSTLHQDYQRQVDALLKLGIREEDIFKDKKSGKDFNREEFRKLMHILRPGDCIVVVELDRFGRSMAEIKKQWFWITQQRQADIIVLDQPVLNTRLGVHGLGAFLADLVLAVFSLMAEIERKLINKRVEEGIRLARLAGRRLGRRLMEIPALFWKLKEGFLSGRISQNMASRELGVDPKTFRSWVERTGDIPDAQEWEARKGGIEEQEREERIRKARIAYGEVAGPAGAGERQEAAEGQKTAIEPKTAAGRETAEGQETVAGRETAEGQETAAERETVAGQEAAGVQEMDAEQETGAGGAGVAAVRDMPAGSGMADLGGRPGHARQAVEKSHETGEGAGSGVAGSPARAGGGDVGKAGRDKRRSKRQKPPGKLKKNPAPDWRQCAEKRRK